MNDNNIIEGCLRNDSDEINSGKGKNVIYPKEKKSLWKGYIEKFKDPIIIVLLVVFCFSILVSIYEIYVGEGGVSLLLEPIGILVALLLATGVGFIFEVKANNEFQLLNKVKDTRPVKVYRIFEGDELPNLICVPKRDIVVGDIVKLEPGDEVPADGIILKTLFLRVDESNFTGEMYANKSSELLEDESTYPSNFLLRGSNILEGDAVYRVTAIGMDTEEGHGIKKIEEGSNVKTPLDIQLGRLGKYISIVSFVIAIFIVIGRLIYFFVLDGNPSNNTDLLEIIEFTLSSVMIAVTLIVVAVPEGLPMSVTISLALSMRRMLKENNLVRKLHACETMGAATVICTDKTGTLTQNKMTVTASEFYGDKNSVFNNIIVNSTAEITIKDDKLSVIGNPTEGALLRWLNDNGIDYNRSNIRYELISRVPFSTERKYMETTVSFAEDKFSVRFLKGAPEVLLAMCTKIANNVNINDVNAMLRHYQSKAMRTLAFASQNIINGENGDIVLEAIVGISDPIRLDVKDAIHTCKDNAGVRVIIVTGDNSGTANEIARQIGLIDESEVCQQLTGIDFAAMSDEEAKEMLPKLKVLSRARPDDKARLVTLLQEMGEVVAVTGDGTNDAPALSKAQVGLSMGDGTAVAKEASDITIIDNSFSSINKAIMWGRSLYLNIRRFIVFQMTINVCACLVVLLGAFIGLDSPLTVTQMLWVNLIMDTFAAMALSSLPADSRVLNQKPRSAQSNIIDSKMFICILSFGLVFFILLSGLWQLLWHTDITSVRDLLKPETINLYISGIFDISKSEQHMNLYEMGIFFSSFVLLQFWNLFNVKYFRSGRSLLLDFIDVFINPKKVKENYSKGFVFIIFAILFGQIIIVSFGGALFSVSPLTFSDWLWLLIITSPVLLFGEIYRIIKSILHK